MRMPVGAGTLAGMTTTTDPFGPPTAPAPPPGPRRLRRSRTDRVGAGVAGGLGEYFGVDPVLFRVLFATAAFFGGAGVLAYLLAWIAIPEQGTVHAPIDRFVGELRRRRVPVWIVAAAAALLLWAVAFSWWAPGPFFPVMIVVIVLVAIFGRRGRRVRTDASGTDDVHMAGAAAPGSPTTAGVNLAKDDAVTPTSTDRPTWMGETRQWVAEAREASRQRRRRAFPVRITGLSALVVTLAVLAAVDAGTGIALPTYFWVTVGIVVITLMVGLILRRTPWSLATLLVPSVLGLIAFGGTSAQLHDGFGQREWTPTSSDAVQSDYELAFGQAILDLRHVTIDSARTVHITVAAGQVQILLPPTMNATVNTNVRFGVVAVDGQEFVPDGHWHSRGVNVNRTVLPPATATGAPLTIDVHLADGKIAVNHH